MVTTRVSSAAEDVFADGHEQWRKKTQRETDTRKLCLCIHATGSDALHLLGSTAIEGAADHFSTRFASCRSLGDRG